jgi:hypothetical protein
MGDAEPRDPAGNGAGTAPAPWFLGGQPPASPAPVTSSAPAPAESELASPEPAPWSPAQPYVPATPHATAPWGRPWAPEQPDGRGQGEGPAPGAPVRRLTPILLVVAAMVAAVLGVGIYLVGRSFGSVDEAGSSVVAAGPVHPLSVTATCQAPPGADSAGTTVTYEPASTLDDVPATAWRCPGSAVGQQLVYDFGAAVTLTSVGLVPGYAKVDPVDGTDRFAENRTVTAVVWRFDDGTEQRQTIADPGPTPATVEIPGGISTRRLVLEIAGTGNDGAVRDFTAISEAQFAGY